MVFEKTTKDLKRLAFEYAGKDKIPYNFNTLIKSKSNSSRL